jgi:hypothetical protein
MGSRWGPILPRSANAGLEEYLEEFDPKAILQNLDLAVDYRVSFGVKDVRTIGFALMPPLQLIVAPKSLLNAPFPATASTAGPLP